MAFGITANGFVKKSLETIQLEMRNALSSRLGGTVNTSPSSIFGQLIDIFSEREALIWELAEAVYNSQYLVATGVQLDLVSGVLGQTRQLATFAKITDFILVFSGAGTIPAGTTFSSTVDESIKFTLDEDYVATGAGADIVPVTATTSGNKILAADTLTIIDTPVSILTDVTNPTDVNSGRDRETDAELRVRLQTESTTSILNTVNAIENAITLLNETIDTTKIEQALVLENATDSVDSEGRPAHAIEVVVYQTSGATDRDGEISETIAAAKPDGIQLVSTTGTSHSETVELESGNTRYIIFSRPEIVQTEFTVTLTTDPSIYPTDGNTQVKNAIIEYVIGLGIGDDVINQGSASVAAAAYTIPGILGLDVTSSIFGEVNTPDNITIENTQLATTDSGKVGVIS